MVALAALGAALVGFWLARQIDSSAPQLASGTWLPRPREVGDFHLTDQLGKPFSAASLQGAPSLVFFGFTHCPDVCPTTLAQLAALDKLAPVPGLRVIFVSVDPQRDTPTALAAYLRNFDPRFIGVTGDPAAIAAVAANFGVAVEKVPLTGDDYTVDHSAALFLLNASGRIAGIFTPPFDARRLARDLTLAAPHLSARS